MVKKLSCVSCGSLKRFPHTFTTLSLTSVHAQFDAIKDGSTIALLDLTCTLHTKFVV